MSEQARAPARRRDAAPALRGFLFLEALVRLFIWYSALAFTLAVYNALHAWPVRSPIGADLHTVWRWGEAGGQLVLLYNFIYLLELLVLRALVPTPREGTYAFGAGQRLSRQLVWSSCAHILIRARAQAPFPAFLVFHLSNLPPLHWLFARVFGPRSGSCLVLDPPVPDPHHTCIGRNVVVGNLTSIIAHTQYRDQVVLKRTVIEDDVMIGAHALVYSGCTIRRGAVVYGGAVVPPDTVIGENEAWGGVPARKIKDLPPV
jgi:hypothetical protein